MSPYDKIKENIQNEILNVVVNKDYIISTTIVGSFASSPGIEGISDIDTVIIVDKLTQTKFDDINDSFQKIQSSQLGLPDYEVFINNTFGPLKFDNGKNIVFHLMIYDVEGHIEHVEQSPFTCYSWENFIPIKGLSLREVYPVLNLQLKDIIESRRGISSYMEDVENGIITYRKYSFVGRKPIMIKDRFELDLKHRLEYSYHITYNLLNNFYKIISRELSPIDIQDLIIYYSNFAKFPSNHIQFFYDLFLWKRKNHVAPKEVIQKTKLFVLDFFSFVESVVSIVSIQSFRRHEKTALNDGTFLGINRDPSIIETSNKTNDFRYDIGYHSEQKRSKETIAKYYTTSTIKSALLNEINYGLAEGLNIHQLNEKFPEIKRRWEKGEDPKFPDGECQNDVLIRVKQFLNKTLETKKNGLIITHLVVLRMTLYHYLKIDFKYLYKIKIEHLNGFDVLCFNEFQSIEISNSTRKMIRKQLSIIND